MELPLLLAALTLLSISSASDSMCSHTSHVAFKDQSYLLTRQIQFCKPVPEPVTCEASCGPGYIQCVSYPNCFNPSAGETCCSDGCTFSLFPPIFRGAFPVSFEKLGYQKQQGFGQPTRGKSWAGHRKPPMTMKQAEY
jgi:hypothetical protein